VLAALTEVGRLAGDESTGDQSLDSPTAIQSTSSGTSSSGEGSALGSISASG
jgi:hypothetical protein